MRRASLVCCLILTASLSSLAWGDADPRTARTWRAKCAPCHGDDGKGETEQGRKVGIEPITTVAWARAHTDEQIRATIHDGLLRTTADGKKQEMKEFGSRLAPEEIDALVKHVRSLAPAVPAGKKSEEKKAPAVEEKQPAADEKKPAAAEKQPADAKAAAAGEKLWKGKCAGCHGGDGRGQIAKGKKLGVADTTAAAWRAAHPEAQIVELLTGGKKVTSNGKPMTHVARQKLADAKALAIRLLSFPATP